MLNMKTLSNIFQILPAHSFKTSEPGGCVKLNRSEASLLSEKPILVYSHFREASKKYKNHPAILIKQNGKWK